MNPIERIMCLTPALTLPLATGEASRIEGGYWINSACNFQVTGSP
jgi:hypothetical protein